MKRGGAREKRNENMGVNFCTESQTIVYVVSDLKNTKCHGEMVLFFTSTLIWYNKGRVRTYHGLFVLCKYFYWKENIPECLCSE